MNDVKLNNADLGASKPQRPAASSAPPNPGNAASGSSEVASRDVAQELSKQQEIAGIREEMIKESQEQQQEKVRAAVTQLNDYVQDVQRDLQFNLDDTSGKTVITVVDRQTAEVVRQIPDDVALRLARDLQQDEPLSLFNAKV